MPFIGQKLMVAGLSTGALGVSPPRSHLAVHLACGGFRTELHHHISGPGYLHLVLCAVLARGCRGHRGSSSGAEAV